MTHLFYVNALVECLGKRQKSRKKIREKGLT